MPTPATGTTWAAGGYADLDNRLFQRGGIVAILIRDYGGAATNISPANFTPFALDGKIRGDLFAITKVGGNWVINPSANLGFWSFGALGEKQGPERRPTIKNDDYMILQSNWPFDSDLISEGEEIRFTAVETLKPMLMRVRNNLPLTDPATGNIIVDPAGKANYGLGKPQEASLVERQILLYRKRAKAGKIVYTVEGFPLCKLTGIGPSKKDKQAADASELTFTVLPDPYMVDTDGTPLMHYEWVGGDGWSSILGTTSWLVTTGAQTTGTFTLTWGGNTTAPITTGASLPTSATVKTALVALDDDYLTADWTVTGSSGGPFTITPPLASPVTGPGASLGTPGTFIITPV